MFLKQQSRLLLAIISSCRRKFYNRKDGQKVWRFSFFCVCRHYAETLCWCKGDNSCCGIFMRARCKDKNTLCNTSRSGLTYFKTENMSILGHTEEVDIVQYLDARKTEENREKELNDTIGILQQNLNAQ